MITVKSVALLASALSSEYKVNVTVGGKQAYTAFGKKGDVTINIPSIDLQNSNYINLLRGFVDHEIAHVRFTDRPDTNSIVNKNGAVKNIANVFEDVYVERMFGECYPGCKRNLRKMVELVYTSSEEGKGPDDPAPMSDVLQDFHNGTINARQFADAMWAIVINYILYRVRSQVVESIVEYVPKYRKLVDDLMPGLAQIIDPIIERVPIEGVNSEANNALAVEMEEVIRNFMNENKQEMNDAWSCPQEGQSSGEQDDQENNTQTGGSDEQENQKSSTQNTEGGAEEPQGDEQNAESREDSTPSNGTGDRQKVVTKETQAIIDEFGQAGESMQENDTLDIAKQISEVIDQVIVESKEAEGLHPGRMETARIADTDFLSPDEIKDSVQTSVALDAQLQSLLQTYVLNRGGIGRMGRLDTNRLHKLAIGSDKIFKKRVDKQGIDTEIIVVVDMSGSMNEYNKDTLTSKSLYAVMKSLRKIQGCTSRIMGFSSHVITDILNPQDKLTTRLKIRPNGGTYCGEALMQAMSRFSPSNTSRKIVIMMTDGETSNKNYFSHVIKSAKNSGIELVGIGIMDTAIKSYLPSNECCIIKNLSQMTPELFRILRGKLLRHV